jgi:urease accessory protein
MSKGMIIQMTETATHNADLYRLMTWLSPSYPVGAYSYSHGLEFALEDGSVTNAASVGCWIADAVELGGGFSDTVLLAAAHGAASTEDQSDVIEIAELAVAFQPTAELARESQGQGRAFLDMTAKAWPCTALTKFAVAWNGPYAYPVVVGVAGAGHGLACTTLAHAYLHAFAANLVSAAVRLVPLGQSDGQWLVAELEPVVAASAARACATPIDDLASCAYLIDIASAQHETQYTRLFRS